VCRLPTAAKSFAVERIEQPARPVHLSQVKSLVS
jgi:hypothetical protein